MPPFLLIVTPEGHEGTVTLGWLSLLNLSPTYTEIAAFTLLCFPQVRQSELDSDEYADFARLRDHVLIGSEWVKLNYLVETFYFIRREFQSLFSLPLVLVEIELAD